MPKKSPVHVLPPAARSASRNHARTLNLLRAEHESIDTRDQELVCFDVDEDLESLVPMPDRIPARIRSAITELIGSRFSYADELDAWLHEPNGLLHGVTPFERIVAGDGAGVLLALADGVPSVELAELLDLADPSKPNLKLVR
jgi:hypothetical protein